MKKLLRIALSLTLLFTLFTFNTYAANYDFDDPGIVESDYTTYPVLRKGDTGEVVEKLQTLLNDHGYTSVNTDGIFGSITEKYVKKYQSSNGLSVDGIVGSNTWRSLFTGANKKEWKIIINLESNRTQGDKYGTLKLYVDNKKVLSCQCRGQGNLIDKNKRTFIPWYKKNGNTPTGTVKGCIKYASSNTAAYGPYKRIDLAIPISGNFKEAYTTYGRSDIQIHGGRSQTSLWNTSGCIRVFDKNMKKIIEYVENCEKYGLVTIREY